MTETRYNVVWGKEPTDGDVLARDKTYKEAQAAMVKHQRKNFPDLGQYLRMWRHEDGTEVVDYGSWSNFYYLVPVDYWA